MMKELKDSIKDIYQDYSKKYFQEPLFGLFMKKAKFNNHYNDNIILIKHLNF